MKFHSPKKINKQTYSRDSARKNVNGKHFYFKAFISRSMIGQYYIVGP